MAVGNIKDTRVTGGEADSPEMVRLKLELAQTKKRLEEEVSYYRGELENTRKRVEDQNVRTQADEVSRRRRAEEQVLLLKADLADAEAEAERNRQHYETLAQQLKELEEQAKRHMREEVDKVRAASKVAWKNAEDELETVEQELSDTRRLLAKERERVKQLEASLTKARQEAAIPAAPTGPDAESLRLIGALKKALWATAQARRKAEMQLASLQAGEPVPAEPETARRERPAAVASTNDDGAQPTWLAQPMGPIDPSLQGAWQTLKVGELDEQFSDEFMLMAADASLDRETFEQVQQLTATPPSPAAKAASKPAAPRQERVQLPPPEEDGDSGGRRRFVWVLLLFIAGGLFGGAYWLWNSGLLLAGLG